MAKWTIDPDHTVAAFAVRHLMVTNVRGQFNRVSGTIHYDPGNLAALSVEAEIEAAALWTGIQKRDEHLRSEDFFHVEKYPKISFRTGKVEWTGSNLCKVTGDLTIRDVTRSVILDVEIFGPVTSVMEDERATVMGFTGTTEVNREDYGLTWNVDIGGGGLMAGRYIRIVVNAEADLAAL